MMNRYIILLFLLLLGGCGRPAAVLSDSQFDENGAGDSVHAIRIPIVGEFMGEYPLTVVGDRIVMGNPGAQAKNFSVYIFSGDSLKKEGEFLNRGRGPYEMMHADLSFDPQTRQFGMLADWNAENRFCRVRLDTVAKLYDLSKWEYRTLPYIGKNSLGASCLIEGSTFLTLGHHVDSLNMFSILDIENERVVPLDFKFPAVPIELSPIQQDLFWNGRLYKHPIRRRFVYSAQDFKYLFVFEVDAENRLHVVRAISDNLPAVHAVKDMSRPFSFDDSCEDGCFPIAVSDQYIYVGYTQETYGHTREMLNSGGLPSRRIGRINVYDWDGNFVRRLVLDTPVSGPMVVCGDQLVAYSTDPETAEDFFVRYPL